jgi:hypothetical protein
VSGRSATPLSEVAQTLGISEGAARTALHRLRRRYGSELRAEVAGPGTRRIGAAVFCSVCCQDLEGNRPRTDIAGSQCLVLQLVDETPRIRARARD